MQNWVYNGTQSFTQELPTLLPLEEDEDDVSYDVESLLITIPAKEMIDR